MAYIGKSPDGTGVRARYYFTATGGETSLSGADDNAVTLSFADGAYVDVYLNGVLLVAGTDYNTTTANTISGLTALAANDIVEILVYDIFTVADTVSASAGGTFAGAVGFSGGITGDVAFDTDTLKVDSSNNRTGLGNASPETTVHIEGDVSGLNDGNVMHIEGNGAGGNRGINIGQKGDGSQARMFLQGYHSQSVSNTWDLLLNPDGGSVGIGTDAPTTYGDSNTKLAVVTPTSNANDVNIRFGTNDVKGIIFVNDASGDGVGFGTTTNHQIQFNTNNTARMTIGDSGVVYIGGSTTRAKVNVERNDASSYNYASISVSNQPDHFVFFNDSTQTGSIARSGGSGVSYNTSSDYRLKEAVVDMTGAIDRVKALAPKRFNFIADADTTVDGFLAHEAQAVVPEAVTGEHNEVDEDGNAVMQGIDQSKLVPLLTAALKESIAKIETLETKVAALEAGS